MSRVTSARRGTFSNVGRVCFAVSSKAVPAPTLPPELQTSNCVSQVIALLDTVINSDSISIGYTGRKRSGIVVIISTAEVGPFKGFCHISEDLVGGNGEGLGSAAVFLLDRTRMDWITSRKSRENALDLLVDKRRKGARFAVLVRIFENALEGWVVDSSEVLSCFQIDAPLENLDIPSVKLKTLLVIETCWTSRIRTKSACIPKPVGSPDANTKGGLFPSHHPSLNWSTPKMNS